MFGYVRPRKSELLVREFQEYGGVYCSLCRRLGKDYGILSRLAINYDCTFYALLSLAVSKKEDFSFFQGRCVVNPLKKCVYCPESGREFASASALTVFLTYFKIRDDIEDSNIWKSFLFLLLLPIASRARKKAARKFPEMDKIITLYSERQKKVEQGSFPGLDACAHPTAEMLSQIFALTGKTDNSFPSSRARIFRQIGYYLGRWIYLMDSADDIQDDIKHHSFNPFVQKFQLNLNSTQKRIDAARTYANDVLNGTLAKLNAAADLLDYSRFEPILSNIVSKGLPQMQNERLFEKENRNVRSL